MPKKISAKDLVADIKADMSNWHLMQKHQLTYPQLVLVLAALAKKGLITQRSTIDAVEAPIEVGNLAYAKSLYTMLQQKCPGIRGMKALGQRLDEAETFKTFMADYHSRLAKPCIALETFATEHPGIELHPEIRRLIWMYELSMDEILNSTVSFFQHLVTISSRLKLAADNAAVFKGLSPVQANRMWHFLALKLYADNGVINFVCFSPSDMPQCDVCVRIDCQAFNVRDTLQRINQALDKGNILLKHPFPSVRDLDNIPPDEMKKKLVKGGWYLPPFCNECRCQVLPSILGGMATAPPAG